MHQARRKRIIYLASFCCLLLPLVGFSQSQRQLVDSLFYGANGLKAKYPEVGIVVGIIDHGRRTYYALGTRRKHDSARMDSATIFEIGSATKTFTGLLLADAIQRGVVGRSDVIDRYLPPTITLAAAVRNKVKLTDLAAHQSGLPNLSSDRYFDELLQRDPRNPFRFVDKPYLYRLLRETKALTKPGAYQYNNYAFALLGDLLAKAEHQPYAALLTERILQPYQLRSTSLRVPNTTNVAGLYNQRGEPQDYLLLNAVNPAGGLKSNAVDLLTYLLAYMAPTHDSAAIALTRHPFHRSATRTVGLGWDVRDGYYEKDGDTFGNSMLMRYHPQRQLVIVVLSNHQNGQLVRDAVEFIYQHLPAQ